MCEPARKESRSSKLAGRFYHPKLSNHDILEYCSGAKQRARHIGDYRETTGSIFSTSKVQSNRSHFRRFHFAEAIIPIFRLPPKFLQTSERLVLGANFAKEELTRSVHYLLRSCIEDLCCVVPD